MMTPDGLYVDPFSALDGGLVAFNSPDAPLIFPCYDEPVFSPLQNQQPVFSNSGFDNSNPLTKLDSNFGSDEFKLNGKISGSNSGSDDISPPVESVSVVNERKRRRMDSNRESARRSRMRKQTHLENLRSQLNRLKVTNHELMNQLRFATHQCQNVSIDNNRLRSEVVVLQQRLCGIRQLLIVRQLQQQLSATTTWPCNNNFTVPMNYDESTIPQSLIT